MESSRALPPMRVNLRVTPAPPRTPRFLTSPLGSARLRISSPSEAMKATSTRRETSGPRRDYAKLHAGSMRASPGTTQALAEQAFEVLSSGGANSQKEAAAMMGINEKAVSRVKLKTKAPYTKCHTGSTQTVELELGVTWTKELSYGDSKAERGEAQARAERNYKRKRAALAEVARRRAAEDCGGGALSEPMDEAEEDASRRESASKVGSPTLGRL